MNRLCFKIKYWKYFIGYFLPAGKYNIRLEKIVPFRRAARPAVFNTVRAWLHGCMAAHAMACGFEALDFEIRDSTPRHVHF
jgi:hypothetical protein